MKHSRSHATVRWQHSGNVARRRNLNSISWKISRTARSSPCIATATSLTSAPVRTSCAPGISGHSNSRTWRVLTTRAMRTTLSSSAFMAPHSKTKRRSTNTSPCSKRRKSETIVKSARIWASSPWTRSTLGPVFRSGCQRGRQSSRNWKSWPRKPNSLPATSASGLRTSRGRRCM